VENHITRIVPDDGVWGWKGRSFDSARVVQDGADFLLDESN